MVIPVKEHEIEEERELARMSYILIMMPLRNLNPKSPSPGNGTTSDCTLR
jgi:hypothetical protein